MRIRAHEPSRTSCRAWPWLLVATAMDVPPAVVLGGLAAGLAISIMAAPRVVGTETEFALYGDKRDALRRKGKGRALAVSLSKNIKRGAGARASTSMLRAGFVTSADAAHRVTRPVPALATARRGRARCRGGGWTARRGSFGESRVGIFAFSTCPTAPRGRGARLSPLADGASSIRCDGMRTAKHAPRGLCSLLEHRHGLAEIVERRSGSLQERLRVKTHLERVIMIPPRTQRHGHCFAQHRRASPKRFR